MAVYIDSWGHLFSDQSVSELWSVASRIGLRAEWNHYSKGFPHFDLTTEGKKMLAVMHGAKSLSIRDQEWRTTVDGMMRTTFNRAWHERCAVCQPGMGLVGQKILRLDIPATMAREDKPASPAKEQGGEVIICVFCGREVNTTGLTCCGAQYALNGTYQIPGKPTIKDIPKPPRDKPAMAFGPVSGGEYEARVIGLRHKPASPATDGAK